MKTTHNLLCPGIGAATALTIGLLFAGPARAANPIVPTAESLIVSSGNLAIELAPDGRVVGMILPASGIRRALAGETRLAGCSGQGPVASRRTPDGGAEFEKTLVGRNGASCRLIERFRPLSGSIRWEIEIEGMGEPWSLAIETALSYPEPWRAKFWTPRGDSRQDRFQSSAWADLRAAGVLPDAQVGDWADPLVPMPFTSARLFFGAPAFSTENPGLAFIPFQPDLFGIPLASILEPDRDLGLSLALSPEDPYLDMTLATSPAMEVRMEVDPVTEGRDGDDISNDDFIDAFGSHPPGNSMPCRGVHPWFLGSIFIPSNRTLCLSSLLQRKTLPQ